MLDSLHIENIAVIEKANVTFSKGFTVLTGETGAGKSIIIDSINAVLGERTSKELIRTGCDKGVVTAVFSCISQEINNKLEELGFSKCDGELLITRTLTETKSSCKINGENAPAFVLRELAPMLVNIHGQHDSSALLNPDKHYLFIDLLANNHKLLEEYQECFSSMLKTRKMVKQYQQAQEDREKQIELLTYQINEIESADVKIGEKVELNKRKNEIINSQKIKEALLSAYNFIAGDESIENSGASELIESASNQLISVSEYSEKISKTSDKLNDLKYQIEEIKDVIDKLIDDNDFDKSELELVDQRLDMYYNFSEKYGENEKDILEYLEKAKVELKKLDTIGELSEEYSELLPKQIEKVKELGLKLTESRRNTGLEFSKKTEEQLKYLDMNSVKIEVDIQKTAYSTLGADKIEFLISTNPGEPLKPLAKIASGGEMSRIMLAIKNVLSQSDPVCTLIFDEIDSGISGSAATKVGKKLKETSNGKQVICVTHLAQIATMADTHLLITKNIVSNRAVTDVQELDFDGRKNELARIIGSEITESSLQTADEMLKKYVMN